MLIKCQPMHKFSIAFKFSNVCYALNTIANPIFIYAYASTSDENVILESRNNNNNNTRCTEMFTVKRNENYEIVRYLTLVLDARFECVQKQHNGNSVDVAVTLLPPPIELFTRSCTWTLWCVQFAVVGSSWILLRLNQLDVLTSN